MKHAERRAIDTALREAHADLAPARMARLYEAAANGEEASGRIDAACFFLTQAWIFALDASLDDAERLEARLRVHGRA